MKLKNADLQVAFLAAMMTAGNCLAGAKIFGGEGIDLISSVLAAVLSVLTLFISLKLAGFVAKRVGGTGEGKLLLPLLFTAAGLLCIISAVYSLSDTVLFISDVVAPELSLGIVILILLLLVVSLVASRLRAMLKFSLILLPIVLALLIFIFGFSTPYMSLKYIIPRSFPEMGSLLSATAERYILDFLPVILPLSVLAGNNHGSAMFGHGIGAALSIAAVLNTLLIFGADFAAGLSYPFSAAVSAVSLGELFSRMDGLLYVVGFFTGLVRISGSVLAAILLFGKIKR